MKLIKRLILVFFSLFALNANSQNVPVHSYKVAKDVEWAKPGGFSLTMDIYTPVNVKKSYPVVVIYHGGGWLIYNKSNMSEMAQYLTRHGYVVCNINYRLLGAHSNTITMDQIIGDGLGALLWVKYHIKPYKGDPKKVCVTGDSSGGQLASMVVNSTEKLTSKDFTSTLLFTPTWMPKGTTPEEIAKKHILDVQAAVINYGGTNMYEACKYGFENSGNPFWEMAKVTPRGIFGGDVNVNNHPEYYKAVSPMFTIPQASQRKLPPQLFTVGSKDNIVLPEWVQGYVKTLKDAGQPAEYWEYEGRPHAFLDSGGNKSLGTTFDKDAIPALERMLKFLNGIFY
ncbi:MAG TPA: alpha/beta hydrolase [Mucilaginibacter sp.]|nr:alpha/beta hydrolase [Mucilaginibacter sp.]